MHGDQDQDEAEDILWTTRGGLTAYDFLQGSPLLKDLLEAKAEEKPKAELEKGQPKASLEEEEQPTASTEEDQPEAEMEEEQPKAAMEEEQPKASLEEEQPKASTKEAGDKSQSPELAELWLTVRSSQPLQLRRLIKALPDKSVAWTLQDEDGMSLMHRAVWTVPNDRVFAVVALLLQSRAEVDPRNLLGETPLMLACRAAMERPADASIWGPWLRPLRKLLEARADPNAADLSGEPPLIEAACAGDVEVCQLLLEANADASPESSVLRRKKGHRKEEENVQKPKQKGRKPQPDTYLPNYQETLVHYHKSFGVLQELFDHRDFLNFEQEIHDCAAAASTESLEGPRFLDLGCAPGGFSACLLQDHILGPMSVGYGVSLPPQLGGFQMAITTSRLCVQFEDLLQINSCDLMCIDNSIDICVADAQYLSNMFKPQHQTAKYRGMKTRNRTLGIWALTVKECQIAFAKLRQSGSFIFRFGWRGVGTSDVHPTGEPVHPSLLAKYLQEEEWYTALTHWLFSVLKSLFSTLRPFKSEYVHQADVSFYMVCRNFDREKFALCGWEAKLQRAYHELTNCEDEATLVAGLKESINQDTKLAIDELLDYVGRMRAIGIQSRKVTNPSALGWKSDSNSQKEKDEKDDKEKEQTEKEEDKVEDKEEKATTTTVVKSDASTELEERSESSTGTEVRGSVTVPPPPPPPRSGPKPPGRCVSQPTQKRNGFLERREVRNKNWGKGTGIDGGGDWRGLLAASHAVALSHINAGVVLYHVERMRLRRFEQLTLRAVEDMQRWKPDTTCLRDQSIINILHSFRSEFGYDGPSPVMILPCRWSVFPTTEWLSYWNSPEMWMPELRRKRRYPGIVSVTRVELFCPDEMDMFSAWAFLPMTDDLNRHERLRAYSLYEGHKKERYCSADRTHSRCCACGEPVSLLHIAGDMKNWPAMQALLRAYLPSFKDPPQFGGFDDALSRAWTGGAQRLQCLAMRGEVQSLYY
eukprot:s210_g31.t1